MISAYKKQNQQQCLAQQLRKNLLRRKIQIRQLRERKMHPDHDARLYINENSLNTMRSQY
ncbi:MAG: hypothetical protein JSC085_000462 [Candidatus Tokpelaia sp. JSC085]|nr:MAG: hypothetical protein JSC085_000462 [Candidatus Tokpelaia sp. JSC085]